MAVVNTEPPFPRRRGHKPPFAIWTIVGRAYGRSVRIRPRVPIDGGAISYFRDFRVGEFDNTPGVYFRGSIKKNNTRIN
jgi:hypothetical protein